MDERRRLKPKTDGVRLGAVDGYAQAGPRPGVRVPRDSDFELARRAAIKTRQGDDGSFRNMTLWIGSENQTPPAGRARIDPYLWRLHDKKACSGQDYYWTSTFYREGSST